MKCTLFRNIKTLIYSNVMKCTLFILLQEIHDLSLTVDELTKAHHELRVQLLQKGAEMTRSSSPEKHHLVVEVAELKSKVRRLKQEL